MISILQNQIKRRLNTMDQCQAETGTRWSTTPPSLWGASCPRAPGPPAVWPCPAWWATPPPGSVWPWPMARAPAGRSTPRTVTRGARPRPSPPDPRVITAISGRSALGPGPPVTTGAMARVSREEERKLGGYSAITWGAGRPPPPPPRPRSLATLSAPPPVRLITALSFLTHFPTRDQLVFQ